MKKSLNNVDFKRGTTFHELNDDFQPTEKLLGPPRWFIVETCELGPDSKYSRLSTPQIVML